MHHRRSIWFGSDGSYIIYQRFERGQWRTRSMWLIPNTYFEDINESYHRYGSLKRGT